MLVFKDPENKINIAEFHNDVKDHLPSYTKPTFVRVVKQFITNASGTVDRERYIEAGYDPGRAKEDKLYYFSEEKKGYEILTPDIFKDIVNDKLKLY